MTTPSQEHYALRVPFDGAPTARVPPLEHECAISGLRLIALPPGRVEIDHLAEVHMLDVNLNAVAHEVAAGGDRMRRERIPADSVGWVPNGCDFRLRTRNHLWGLLLEFEPDRAHALVAERLDGRALPERFVDYRHGPRAAMLARLAIDHLRGGGRDRLLLEGLGLAILGDALGVMEAADPSPGAGGPGGIGRVLDLIEARLGENLSMVELAAAAAMSPSWFAARFRAATGRSVFAHVRERRLDRARAMLPDRRLSLGAIAAACGFADQSHMTRAFRRRWDTTPGRMRQG